MKKYSFLAESYIPITKEKESHILNDIVYHSSSIKMSVIKGKETKNALSRFGFGVVFVSPYKYLSSCFIIDQFIIKDLICKKYNIKDSDVNKFSCFADTMKKKISSLSEKQLQTTYPKYYIVDTRLEDKNGKLIQFKDFKDTFTGYIHYIDYRQFELLNC